MFLYVTCDRIGSGTGGGTVTKNELEALSKLGSVDVFTPQPTQDPFQAENEINIPNLDKYKLAHFYAGTFPQLTKKLKEKGIKISYTAAAHDIQESQEEFKSLGIPYDFPHITQKNLWERYLSSYQNADTIICPSKHSKEIMRDFGCKNIEIVPHGCHKGHNYAYPKTFSVGYLGQIGPDKGIKYLVEAWSRLNYNDAILTIAGVQSVHLINMIRAIGGKSNYNMLGYVKTLNEFYKEVSVYVQPSVTEGFGIEVLEAMSYGRPVIVSDGAGSADCVNEFCKIVEKRNVEQIMSAIDWYKTNNFDYRKNLMAHATNFSWDNIQKQYCEIWKNMLEN